MISKVTSSKVNNYPIKEQSPKTQSFRGGNSVTGVIQALRFLDNSPAIGACAVDVGSMVVPRTIVDTKNRGVDAGAETMIREGASTINHALVGVVGAGAATAVSSAINKQYNVRADKIFANSDSIDVFSNFWKQTGNLKDYYTNILGSIEGLDGSQWKKISGQDGTQLIESIAEKLTSGKVTKDVKKDVVDSITSHIGAKNNIRLTSSDKTVTESLDVIVDNMTSLGKSFKDKSGDVLDGFVKQLKKSKVNTALLGLGITTLIGISVQPINKLITKKRTGKDGFVGVEGREADKTGKFKAMKTAAAATMGTYAMRTIGKNPADILSKLQFSSKIPNLNQFKFIYGMTIMSRILSSRDKNELRESCIKDFLGFTNWLILGGMVSKVTARALPGGKDLINYVPKTGEKGIKKAFNWITKASVKGYDEVLAKGLGKQTLDSVKNTNFASLLQKADKATKGNVGKLALAQVAGYLYSGIVLGIGIAKLNIFITNKIEKNKKSPKFSDPSVVYFAQKNMTNEKPQIFSSIKS